MKRHAIEPKKRPRIPQRALAALVLGTFALAGAMLASTSREPMKPLQLFERWRLERQGARFVALGGARLQASLNDCGPTALADLLDVVGLPVPSPDSLRLLTATNADGTTLDRLAKASAQAGLMVFRLRWDPSDLALLPLPSLVWVERRHFVLVERRVPVDSLEIHDPAAGRYRMAGAQFERLWTGDALVPLDSISPNREAATRSVTRSHRLRGTRAVAS